MTMSSNILILSFKTFASLMNLIFLFLNILLTFGMQSVVEEEVSPQTKVLLQVANKMWHQIILVIK